MATDHAVNANLLRKWIRDYERERIGAGASKAIESQAMAFVSVVEVDERLAWGVRNRVTAKLDFNEHDACANVDDERDAGDLPYSGSILT